eukprot:2502587-Rhodomonas_salina.8
MSGTELAYGGGPSLMASRLTWRTGGGRPLAITTRDLRYLPTREKARAVSDTGTCYALSGTDVAYGATSFIVRYRPDEVTCPALLRLCCTLYSTDLGRLVSPYNRLKARALAMQCPVLVFVLRACYAMSGTEIGYAATRIGT